MIRTALAAWLGAVVIAGAIPLAAPGAVPQAAAAPSVDADSLIVSLGDVQRLTGRDDLVAEPIQSAPAPESGDPHAPVACQAVYSQEGIFGAGWKLFRTAAYSAETGMVSTMAVVMQAVAVYPDAKAAGAVFDRLVPALQECAELHDSVYDFGVSRPDSSTVVLDYRVSQRSVVYRLKSSVLINVVAGGFPDPGQVGAGVAQRIAERVK